MSAPGRNHPLVSLVIPTKDRCDLLVETLDSVRGQTYAHLEAIVVDDGSSDGTADYLKTVAAADARIRPLLRQGITGGANACRNQGAQAATGEYIIFLDSDDLLTSECLATRVEHILEHPQLDFAVFCCRLFSDRVADTHLTWNTPASADALDRFLIVDNPWQTSGPIYTRQAVARIGPWDERLLSWQEYEYNVRSLFMGLKYTATNVVDYHYRLPFHRDSATTAKHARPDHVKSRCQMILSILDTASQSKAFTPDRAIRLAGLCMSIAELAAARVNAAHAARVWRACRKHGLITRAQLLQGLAFFRVCKIPRLRYRMKKYLQAHWPAELFPPVSSTLFHAPITPDMSGPALVGSVSSDIARTTEVGAG